MSSLEEVACVHRFGRPAVLPGAVVLLPRNDISAGAGDGELAWLLRGYGRMELGCPWAGAALGCPGT